MGTCGTRDGVQKDEAQHQAPVHQGQGGALAGPLLVACHVQDRAGFGMAGKGEPTSCKVCVKPTPNNSKVADRQIVGLSFWLLCHAAPKTKETRKRVEED